jgi:hypothetical protein
VCQRRDGHLVTSSSSTGQTIVGSTTRASAASDPLRRGNIVQPARPVGPPIISGWNRFEAPSKLHRGLGGPDYR